MSKKKTPKVDPEQLVTIHPVDGFFVLGVASIAQELPQARADELVATGAFTFDPPPDAPAEPTPSPADAEPSTPTEA